MFVGSLSCNLCHNCEKQKDNELNKHPTKMFLGEKTFKRGFVKSGVLVMFCEDFSPSGRGRGGECTGPLWISGPARKPGTLERISL